MPRLIDLVAAYPGEIAWDERFAGLEINHITADSREVKPGSLFVALPGAKADGAQFIAQAMERGAVAVLKSEIGNQKSDSAFPASDFCFLFSDSPRRALAHLAAAFYPRQPEYIVAVTGTDGKTSTADFFRQLAHLCGHKSASIGTLGVIDGEGTMLHEGMHTTPDPVSLHRLLQELADAGITHVALEASSHGLDQHRLDGVRLSAAAFTNLTRDHLDYHGNEEAYFAAKARLFETVLPKRGTAVLNVDDKRFHELNHINNRRQCQVIGYGSKHYSFADIACAFFAMPFFFCSGMVASWPSQQHLTVESIQPKADGQSVRLSYLQRPVKGWVETIKRRKRLEINLPLIGSFQIYNLLAAVGLLVGCGETELERLLNALPQLKGVPGRLEHVATLENGAAVYIDYAHTPAALAKVLETVRRHAQRRLHVVFGCGGDRDAGKRAPMGKAAARLADVVTVTDDNPRSEDPAAIRASVLEGCVSASRGNAKEVAERRQAIYVALQALSAGDVLVVAGKGHEKTQTIAGVAHPFDDAAVIREALRELNL